MLLAAVIPAVL